MDFFTKYRYRVQSFINRRHVFDCEENSVKTVLIGRNWRAYMYSTIVLVVGYSLDSIFIFISRPGARLESEGRRLEASMRSSGRHKKRSVLAIWYRNMKLNTTFLRSV